MAVEYRSWEGILRECVSNWSCPTCSQLPCFPLYYYYPTTCGWEVEQEDWEVRRIVWNFKANPHRPQAESETKRLHQEAVGRVIPLFERVLKRYFGEDVHRLTLCCIPASTKAVTEKRYRDFSDRLCCTLGMTNGYGYIDIKRDGEAKHTGGNTSAVISIDLTFFRDKYVILFDDIITSGRSIENIRRILENNGAVVIAGLSIGKTAHTTHGKHPIDLL